MIRYFLFLFAFLTGTHSRPVNIRLEPDSVILVDFDPIENLQEYNEIGPIFFQVKQPNLLEHINKNFNGGYYNILDNQEYIDSYVEENYNDLILVSKSYLELESNHSCDICKILVNSVEREIKIGNKTISEISEMIKHICSLVGGPSGLECNFIIDNLDKVIYYVEHGLSTIDICVILGSCSKNDTNTNQVYGINELNNDVNLLENYDSNTTCKLCHILVSVIEKELKTGNKTINDIISIIEDVCRIVGGPDGAECNFIVNSIQEIINYLNKGFNNLKVCELLHLCNQTTKSDFNIDNMSSKIGEL